MLSLSVASRLKPDALLLTRDLADWGDLSTYPRLRPLAERVAEALGCEAV